MTAPPDLEDAYRRTLYRVGTLFTLRCGEPSPEADALLAQHVAWSWAFLTACNPGSVIRPDDENAARNRELAAEAASRNIGFVEGVGESPDGGWREASLFLIGVSEADATALARQFGQLAYLFGERGGAARLVWPAVTFQPR